MAVPAEHGICATQLDQNRRSTGSSANQPSPIANPSPIPTAKGSSFDCEAVFHCLDVELLFFRALNLWNKFGSTFSNIQIPMKLHAANRIFLTSLAPGPGPGPGIWLKDLQLPSYSVKPTTVSQMISPSQWATTWNCLSTHLYAFWFVSSIHQTVATHIRMPNLKILCIPPGYQWWMTCRVCLSSDLELMVA